MDGILGNVTSNKDLQNVKVLSIFVLLGVEVGNITFANEIKVPPNAVSKAFVPVITDGNLAYCKL